MDIFVIETDDIKNVDENLLKAFRHRIFSDKEKEAVHCFSYLMLDRLLKDVYKIENRKLIFINKKPFLQVKEKFFSISHSGDYIAIAFSDYDCGIDIEKMKDRNIKAIGKRMHFSCTTIEEFYMEWTNYEAKYKLGTEEKSKKVINIGDYILTAVSINPKEYFELYVQTANIFPN